MILEIIHKQLIELDKLILELSPKEAQQAFELIPLDFFARMQVDRPEEYPNLIKWFAEMPSSDSQIIWTGSHGHALMTVSLSFMKTVVSTFHEISIKPLHQSAVLDFGCGWGRMLRLLPKYVPTDQLYGVDPWDQSIDICKNTKVKANLFLSEFLPRSLPTPEGQKFDFIFAFSVFTHLSEKTTKLCAATLRDYLSDDGVLAITIRPVEYWNFRLLNEPKLATKAETASFIRQHNDQGFAFFPHGREKIEGDVTYGDTSMSLDYIRDNFDGLEIERVELNETDLYQAIVFLKKSAKEEPLSPMSINQNDKLIPPGELALLNKIGTSADPASAQNEWRHYGRSQMQHWIKHDLITPNSNVLDMGCGLGRVAHSLAGWLEKGSYTGIDIVKSSIDWCSENYQPYSNFRFIHADLNNSHYNFESNLKAASYEFPVDNDSMDFIWSTSLFTHMRINEVDNYLSEMSRVLKPGAKIWNSYFILDEISEPLARSGAPGWSLEHEIEGGLYMTEGDPDHVIAFYLDRLTELHEKHGFEILHVGFGGWSSRPGSNDNGQDVILAQKR
ncbi:MAG: cyclopropane fatty-acyl-phospholipid synthase-like methyltransferase [Arenicella sp.]|jgi:cyclopropane fatty-acyl-phospholipid synthase-like methyltransferase